jgi:hypothetical protein
MEQGFGKIGPEKPGRKEIAMVQARIHEGRVEVLDPIPKAWEGQIVKIVPLTPDDPMPDLEENLAALDALGPTEYEPGERELIEELLGEMDRLSRDEMDKIASVQP